MEVKIKACKKPSVQWSHSPCWAVICIISLAYLVHNSEHIELQTTCKCLQTNRLWKISNMIHQISVAQYQGYTLWYLRYGHVGKRFQVIVRFQSFWATPNRIWPKFLSCHPLDECVTLEKSCSHSHNPMPCCQGKRHLPSRSVKPERSPKLWHRTYWDIVATWHLEAQKSILCFSPRVEHE